MIDSDALPAEPLDALRELALSEAELDDLRHRQVAQARRDGATWEDIGEALGMSRQSAWEYFAKRASERLEASAGSNSDLTDAQATELSVDEVRAARRQRHKAE